MFGKIYGSGYGDIEASIATLERMKPHIFKFFTAFNDPVVLADQRRGRHRPRLGRTHLHRRGFDQGHGQVGRPTEGAVSSGPVMAVVKGGKEDLAKAFMNYALGEEAQKAFCEAMYYGAVNRKVQYSEKLSIACPASTPSSSSTPNC